MKPPALNRPGLLAVATRLVYPRTVSSHAPLSIALYSILLRYQYYCTRLLSVYIATHTFVLDRRCQISLYRLLLRTIFFRKILNLAVRRILIKKRELTLFIGKSGPKTAQKKYKTYNYSTYN